MASRRASKRSGVPHINWLSEVCADFPRASFRLIFDEGSTNPSNHLLTRSGTVAIQSFVLMSWKKSAASSLWMMLGLLSRLMSPRCSPSGDDSAPRL